MGFCYFVLFNFEWFEVNLGRWDLIQSGGKYYQDMDRLVAMEKGLRTWANWVDSNVDITRTRVFFQAASPDHYK